MWNSNWNKFRISVIEWITHLEGRRKEDELRISSLEMCVETLRQGNLKMSAELDALKVKVEAMESLLQSTADGLVSANTNIASLKAELGNPNPDAAAMVALTEEVAAKLSSVQAQLTTPTPQPTPSPAAQSN